MFSAGSSGSCSRNPSAWLASVTTTIRSGGTNGVTRSTVAWTSERSPNKASSCLGRWERLSGHSRVPLPPARMQTYSLILWLVALDRSGIRGQPLHGFLQTRLEIGQRIPAQDLAGPRGIEGDAIHLARAGRRIARLHFEA